MEKLIKGIKIASKIAEVILAISVIGDVVEKYGGKNKSAKVEADVSKEEASDTKEQHLMDHQKQVDVLITLLEVTVSLLKGYKKVRSLFNKAKK